MANDINRSIKIYIDSTEAAKSIEGLEDNIRRLEKELEGLNKEDPEYATQAKKLKSAIESSGETLEKYKRGVEATDRVLKNLSGATYKELIAVKQRMTQELQKTARGTDEYNMRLAMLKKVSKEVVLAQQDMRTEVGCQANAWGRAAGFVNKYMGIIGSGIAAVTGITMAFGRLKEERDNLEESRADLKALTGLDDGSIDWLKKEARRLSTSVTEDGIRIQQSAKEILEAYKLVGSAKPELLLNKEALAEVTEQTLILAAASGMKLTDAVEGVTLAMNQYGVSADQAARYVNVMAAGSKFGSAAVESQTKAIRTSGVAASSANISFEQLSGTIQTLAEKGIKDEIAGTGLKKFFLTLQTGADETNPKVVGLEKALDTLQKKQLSATEIKKRFGEEGYNVASVLIKEAEKVKYYTEAVTGTSVAMEQARIKSETAKIKLAQAKNEMTAMGVELMEKLNPAIVGSMDMTVSWTRKLMDLGGWVAKNTGLIVMLTAVVVGYIAVVKLLGYWYALSNKEISVSIARKKIEILTDKAVIVSKLALASASALLTGNIKGATAAFRMMTAVMGVNPVVAIGVAIAALAVIIYKFCTRTNAAKEAMNEFVKQSVQEQTELDKLYSALRRAGEGTGLRVKLINEFNEKYGEYLPNLLSEESTLIDIKKAYEGVTKAMRENTAAKVLKSRIEKQEEDDLDAKISEMNDIRKELSVLPASVIEDAMADIVRQVDVGKEKGFELEKVLGAVWANVKKKYFNDESEAVPRHLGNQLKDYLKKVYDTAEKVNALKKEFNHLLPKEKIKPANELDEWVVTGKKTDKPDASTGSGAGDDKKEKAELELLLKGLDTKHTEELTRLKKFRLDTNQTEAAYNADLRKEEFAHYAARAKVLEEFKKKVTDKTLLADIDKMMDEGQDKVMETQMKYKEAVNKLLLDANPLDKEKAEYEDRLREVGLFGVKAEDLTKEQKAALEILETQHEENVIRIRREADKEKERVAKETFEEQFKEKKAELEKGYELEKSSVENLGKFDFISEQEVFDAKMGLARRRIDILKEEAEARRKAGLDTIDIQQKIMEAETDVTNLQVEEYARRWQEYKKLATDMGTMLGGVIAGSEGALADMGVYVINLGLDILKKQLQMAAAQAFGFAMATPDSVLSFGATGVARGMIIMGLIEGIFATVKAAIGGSMKNSKQTSLDGGTNAVKTGKRVTGEGYLTGGYTGDVGVMDVAGVVHGGEYVVPAWQMAEPKSMNYVRALEAIRTTRTNTNRFPPAGYMDGGTVAGAGSGTTMTGINSEREMLNTLNGIQQLLLWLQHNPLRAYVVLSEFEKQQRLQEQSKNIGSK